MKKTVQLFALFVFGILLWIFANLFDIPVVLMIVLDVISIIYIFRNKNIEKQDVIIGILLGIVSMPSSWVMGLFTIPVYMGAVSIFKRNGNHKSGCGKPCFCAGLRFCRQNLRTIFEMF